MKRGRKKGQSGKCSRCGRKGHNKATCVTRKAVEVGIGSRLHPDYARHKLELSNARFKLPKGFEDWKPPELNLRKLLMGMRRMELHVPMSWETHRHVQRIGGSDEQFDRRRMWAEKIRLHKYP